MRRTLVVSGVLVITCGALVATSQVVRGAGYSGKIRPARDLVAFMDRDVREEAPAPMLLASKSSRKKWKRGNDSFASGAIKEHGRPINVCPNTDECSKLMLLPLVDASLAQKIIAHRPYRDEKDLIAIVGEQRYRIFKHLLKFKDINKEKVASAGGGVEIIEDTVNPAE
jgi:hypothetical protein